MEMQPRDTAPSVGDAAAESASHEGQEAREAQTERIGVGRRLMRSVQQDDVSTRADAGAHPTTWGKAGGVSGIREGHRPDPSSVVDRDSSDADVARFVARVEHEK